MATGDLPPTPPADQPPPPSPPPWQSWLQRAGTSGKLLAGGGLAGLIFSFLPFYSVSGKFIGGAVSNSAIVVDAWQGKLGLVAYLLCAIGGLLLYGPQPLRQQKNLAWAVLAAGGAALLMAVWLLISALRADSASVGFPGGDFRAGVSFGAFLNVLSGAAAAAGGLLKAREERLF